MAGPWLYSISETSGRKFRVGAGEPPIPVTLRSYENLVNNGKLRSDRYWNISQNWKHVIPGDDLFVYSGNEDRGIIGFAKVRSVEPQGTTHCIRPIFDLKKCSALLANRVPAPIVRAWNLNLRKNVVDLSSVKDRLRAMLPKEFGTSTIEAENFDLSQQETDHLLRSNRLRFGNIDTVPTGEYLALRRQRRGQDRLRDLIVEYYGSQCAVCDITDPSLLVASHIAGWAETPEHRGNLRNVICLCRIHDALFEAGYWSLDNNYDIVRKKRIESTTIRQLIDGMQTFRKPAAIEPAAKFLERHRKRRGL